MWLQIILFALIICLGWTSAQVFPYLPPPVAFVDADRAIFTRGPRSMNLTTFRYATSNDPGFLSFKSKFVEAGKTPFWSLLSQQNGLWNYTTVGFAFFGCTTSAAYGPSSGFTVGPWTQSSARTWEFKGSGNSISGPYVILGSATLTNTSQLQTAKFVFQSKGGSEVFTLTVVTQSSVPLPRDWFDPCKPKIAP